MWSKCPKFNLLYHLNLSMFMYGYPSAKGHEVTNLVGDIYELCMVSAMRQDLPKSAKVFAIGYPANGTLLGRLKLVHIILVQV